MISSNPELADHQENTNEHVLNDSHTSARLCKMCAKGEESKVYCTTCNLQLCLECEFAHKRMLCFQTHCIVPINNVQTSDDFKLEFNKETSYNGIGSKEEIKSQFLEGEKHLKYMEKLSQELEKTLEDLNKDHMVSVNYVNDMFKQFYKLLREERDELIVSIDVQHSLKQNHLLHHKEEIDALIRSFSFKLSNFAVIFEDEGETSVDLDCGPFFTSNCFNNYSSCASSLLIEENGVKITDSDNTTSSSVSVKDNLLPFQGTFKSNYVVSNELPSLPRVSSPRELGFCVIPTHALTSSNPDSLPIKSQVNSMHICKVFGEKGSASAQFNSPHGFCLGSNEDVVVADSSNHRIQIFDKAGRFKMQFGVAGRHDGRLWHPRKVAYLPIQHRYVVCDRGYERSRMQIFSEDGKFLKKIYIQFIDIVAGIAVNENEDIIVVDSVTPTVFIIGYNEFLRSIDCSEFMVEPSDIVSKGM